jgi:type IV secretory pathway VirB2 component (pilin)
MSVKKSKLYSQAYFGLILTMTSVSAFASKTSTDPWSNLLSKCVNALSGPITWGIVTAAVIVSGLSISCLELTGGVKKLVQACFGGAIAVGAGGMVTAYVGFKGICI